MPRQKLPVNFCAIASRLDGKSMSTRRFPFRNKKKQPPQSRSQVPSKGHKPTPAPPRGPRVEVEGVLQLKGHFGFVLSEDPKTGDVMVNGPSLKMAMNGDRVRARVTGQEPSTQAGAPGRRSGEIIEVLTHAHQTVVGVFRRMGNLPVVVPEDEGPWVHLSDLKSFVPHVGDIVTARIETWATAQRAATAVLSEVLGPRDAAGVDMQILIRKHELPDAFAPEVIAEAERWGSEVPDTAWQGRENFFNQRVFTIDGADAKDFDDAVHIERLPDGGWRLGVHIADVAEYVQPGSALDVSAYERGTSVYLSGTVIPMLPFPLSDNLCSLRPDVVRLTLSCVMEIDPSGNIGQARILESAIRSARRFTYDEVETVLRGGTVERVTPEIVADVHEMEKLATLLRRRRFGRGSLDFDFPEPDVVTGLDGKPTDIRKRERLESHRLIEDFMLAANESVARHMQHHPFIYRIHETPDPAKMEKLQKALQLMGLQTPRHLDTAQPAVLQHVIQASEGTPLQATVHLMVLRSLKQAVYSPVNKGHFGLASSCYTHFTSPIRRYPDLIVHRIVKQGLRGTFNGGYWKQQLPAIASHTSRRERIAVDAEREYLDVQKVRLMESRVGDTFDGVVSSVTNFGIFIQLNEFFVEGLVHITRLGQDYFLYDESRMTLRGRRSNRVFAMGQKVKVQLAAANVLKRQLDFELLSSETVRGPQASQTKQEPHKGRHRKHRGPKDRRR
jgi:ribonuclease R